MRRALLRNLSLYSHKFSSSSIISNTTNNNLPRYNFPQISQSYTFKLFSTDNNNNNNDSFNQNPKPSSPETLEPITQAQAQAQSEAQAQDEAEAQIQDPTFDVEDVCNEELKTRIEKYFKGDEDALESVLEAILSRKLKGDHEETDEELMDELEWTPLDNIDDEEFESGFETEHETDEDIENLYSAQDIVVDNMMDREEGDEEEYDVEDRILFNPNDKVWAEAMRESAEIAAEIGPESGLNTIADFRELEEILEDMRDWDKLLPDEIKKKVKAKFDELGDKCERQELEPEEAYKHFKEFEDQIVADYIQKVEKEEESPKSDAVTEPIDQKKTDDPPGVGPILRWHQRVVFAPGGDAWHPKNRKVKLSVKVKELGLSKYQFRRFREIVGKRYHPGKDELTITSERFEHREENRKDCLRTLLNIVEEAGKATALVEEARTSYVKQRLKANPAFMARLHAKTKQASAPISA